ncbi:MAG: DUF7004 family protein [Flavobacteriales bacterium]
MSRIVSIIKQKHLIEFDRGRIDDWCVYLTLQGQRRYAPKDSEYFSRLFELGSTYSHDHIYTDFVRIYEVTDAYINAQVIQLISALAAAYGIDAEEMEVLLTILYAGMIAEENKEKAILKKRIKRLGMHQVLIEKMPAMEAASFSRNKKHTELDALMKKKGF